MSIVQNKVTIIKIFVDISVSSVSCTFIKQKYESFIRIQLRKIDMLVETSTWALGNQYQNGHVESLVPNPKKNNRYK